VVRRSARARRRGPGLLGGGQGALATLRHEEPTAFATALALLGAQPGLIGVFAGRDGLALLGARARSLGLALAAFDALGLCRRCRLCEGLAIASAPLGTAGAFTARRLAALATRGTLAALTTRRAAVAAAGREAEQAQRERTSRERGLPGRGLPQCHHVPLSIVGRRRATCGPHARIRTERSP
jgi:hypothetical protein